MIKRKLISVALSAALIVPLPAAFAAEAETETFRAQDSFEYGALSAMDLLCAELTDSSADAPVSRADFAACLFRLGGYGVQTVANPFIDINRNTLHYEEILTLYNAKIIGGTSNRTFSPNDSITYAQAAKLCVEVLGYGEYAKAKYGDYPHGYVLMAAQLKLDDGVRLGSDDVLTAEAAVQLLYNTGSAKVLDIRSVENGNITYDKNDSKELFESVHDFVCDEGIMTSDGVVNLGGGSSNDGLAVIGGKSYKTASADLSGLLGAKVEFVYKNTSSPELVYAKESDSSDSLVIKAGELVTADSRYSPTCIVYDDGGKIRTASVGRYADFVYNNQLCIDVTKDDYRLIKPITGFVRLTDTDGNGTYDAVIIEEYENLFVTSVTDDGSFIGDKYGNTINLDEYGDVLVYINGVSKPAADIPINRVASVVKSADKNRIYIYVGADGITNTLGSIADGDGGRRLGFGEDEYKLSPTYEELISSGTYYVPEITVGGKYKFWFDKDGDISYLERVDGSSLYAYLINAKVHDEVFGDDSKADLRLLLSTDEKVTVTTADKITIDDTNGMSGADLLSDSRLFDANGDVIRQVVKVTLTAGNVLKKIEIADSCSSEYGYENGRFVKNHDKADGVMRYYGSGIRMFDLKYFVSSDTICFAEFTDSDESEPYHVVSATSLSDKKDYSVNLYDADEKLVIAAMTVSKSRGGISGPLFLVESARKVMSGSDEVYSVTGIYNGKKVTYTELNEGIVRRGLKKGDVIQIGTYNGKISSFKFLYCLSGGKPKPYAAAKLDDEDYACGKIYSVGENNVVILAPDDRIESLGKLISSSFAGTRTKALNLAVYDARFGTMSVGKMCDIAQICSPLADGTLPDTGNDFYIIMNKTRGYIRDAVIVYY